jgi:putative oxidoreductase
MSLLRTRLGWAAVPVRLALGIIFIMHGSQKLFGAFGGQGPAGTVQFLGGMGLHPAVFWGWLVIIVEFFGGLGILFGFLTRIAGLGLTADMVVAIALVHGKNGFFLGNPAGLGYEYNLALIGLSLCLLIGGAGALSIDGAIARGGAQPEASPPRT